MASKVKSRGAYERKSNNDLTEKTVYYAHPDSFEKEDIKFKEHCAIYRAGKKSFSEIASEIISIKKWNVEIFKQRTHLAASIYSRMINGSDRSFSLRTVIAFCIGAGLNAETAKPLIAAAGYSFNLSPEHEIYTFILIAYHGKPIEECK